MFSSMFRSGDLDDGDDRHWLYMFSGEVVYDGDEAVVVSGEIRDNVVVSNVAGCGSSCCSYVVLEEESNLSRSQWEGGKLEENQDEDTSPSKNTSEIPVEVEGFKPPQEEVVPIRRSVRTHRAPDRLCLNVEVEEHSLGDLNEPTNYKAKILDPESNKLIDAMNKKIDMDGKVHTYKARLVAKSFTKTYRVDYEKTLSPVADIRAIRILIAITVLYDYEIWQMDVKIAFLNGYLDKDIYMVQPEGFVDPKYPRKASGSNVTFLILYVDDIIIMENHIPMLQSVKSYLGKCFSMKDLRKAAFILRIKTYRDRSKRLIGLSHSAYMDKSLKRYRLDNSKHGNILMQERLDLNKTQGASRPQEVKCMQNVSYASTPQGFFVLIDSRFEGVWFALSLLINQEIERMKKGFLNKLQHYAYNHTEENTFPYNSLEEEEADGYNLHDLNGSMISMLSKYTDLADFNFFNRFHDNFDDQDFL
ncbi:retrotransposon protein, putative, ty1-copia subclass [Tanacetum coccineum]